MDELTPIYRVEFFLDAIVNDSENPYSPVHRIEYYLAKIAGEDVEIPTPIYRIEYYLAKIAGEDVEIPSPIYRAEFYLAAICGEDVDVPEPLFRIEYWLAEWVEQSGGIEKTIIGNPIHITDALAKPVQALSVALEPIQDLHGYDNPWPAGGGENLFYHQGDMTATANGVTATFNGTTQTITISGTNEAQSAYVLLSIPFTVDIPREVPLCRAFINAPTGTYINFAYRKNGVWVGLNNGGVLPTDTDAGMAINIQLCVYGSATSFDSNNIKVEVERGSTAPTSYSPYSNICPIYGHTDADVTRTGVNVLDDTGLLLVANNIQFAKSVGYGEAFKLKKGVTYTLSTNSATTPNGIYIDEAFSGVNLAKRYDANSVSFTPTADVEVGFNAYWSGGRPSDATHFMLNMGSTAEDYVPYTGTTYPIPLGQTVYGGTLDVLTGVLTINHAFAQFDGTENWNQASLYCYVFGYPPAYSQGGSTQIGSHFGTQFVYNAGNSLFAQQNGAVVKSNRADRDAWKAELAQQAADGKPVQLVYELATPTTIQLTPTQVELLLGENNLFSDGEMTLVYLADGNASDVEALNILLGGRYVNNHTEDEPTDREALDILLGGNAR